MQVRVSPAPEANVWCTNTGGPGRNLVLNSGGTWTLTAVTNVPAVGSASFGSSFAMDAGEANGPFRMTLLNTGELQVGGGVACGFMCVWGGAMCAAREPTPGALLQEAFGC